WIIDTTPATTSITDAPLPVGKTYEDRGAGLSISLLSASATGAQVQVIYRDPPALPDAGAPDAAVKPDAAPPKNSPDADEEAEDGPIGLRNDVAKGCACALGAPSHPGGLWLLAIAGL